MSKKLLRFCSFSIFFILLSCAPKISPPPLYKDVDLSIEELITIVHRDINTLKAIVSINIEENNRPYLFLDASLLLKKPNSLHMRLYKFGLLVGNFIIKDNVVQISSGKGSGKLDGKLRRNLKDFGKELYNSVFWWEDIENASLNKQATEYVIRTKHKEIRLDKSTLLPRSQKITSESKKIYIKYDKPKKEVFTTLRLVRPIGVDSRDRVVPTYRDSDEQSGDDFWYPSVVRIETGTYSITVKVGKLFINPPIGENDFKAPEAE